MLVFKLGLFRLQGNLEGEFIAVIWLIDKSIVQQEASVALFTVRVIDLIASLDVF